MYSMHLHMYMYNTGLLLSGGEETEDNKQTEGTCTCRRHPVSLHIPTWAQDCFTFEGKDTVGLPSRSISPYRRLNIKTTITLYELNLFCVHASLFSNSWIIRVIKMVVHKLNHQRGFPQDEQVYRGGGKVACRSEGRIREIAAQLKLIQPPLSVARLYRCLPTALNPIIAILRCFKGILGAWPRGESGGVVEGYYYYPLDYQGHVFFNPPIISSRGQFSVDYNSCQLHAWCLDTA